MALVSELVTKVTAQTENFIAGMAAVTAAATAAGLGVVHAVDSITDRIDELGKTAQKLGVDFEAFQALKYAADIANVPIEKLQKGMVKLAQNVYDAASGNKEAEASFKRLGLSAADLQKMSLDQQYQVIADAIGKVTNKNEQLALAMKIFGKSGVDNLTLIREGASSSIEEFKSLGLTLTESQRAASEAFQDTKTKMETVFSGFASQVAADVAPAFTILMDELTKSLTGINDLKGAARSLASTLVSVVQFGVNGFDIFLTVLDQVRNRVDQIITGIGNAMQRVGMVHQFLVNAVSGAGISVDPSMIGSLHPVDTAPASGLGGSMSTVQQRLGDLKSSLDQPIMESFIEPIHKAGTALNQFTTATQKATSDISSSIAGFVKSQASDRIKELLGGDNNFNDQRPVYKDDAFQSKYQNLFDAITKQQISTEEFTRAISDLEDRAKAGSSNGEFNIAPNIAAVQDLKKYGNEKGLVGTQPVQKAELKVFVKADKGLITEFSDNPEFGVAVDKWLDIITERAG